MSDAFTEGLSALLAADVAELRRLVGADFGGWGPACQAWVA